MTLQELVRYVALKSTSLKKYETKQKNKVSFNKLTEIWCTLSKDLWKLPWKPITVMAKDFQYLTDQKYFKSYQFNDEQVNAFQWLSCLVYSPE